MAAANARPRLGEPSRHDSTLPTQSDAVGDLSHRDAPPTSDPLTSLTLSSSLIPSSSIPSDNLEQDSSLVLDQRLDPGDHVGVEMTAVKVRRVDVPSPSPTQESNIPKKVPMTRKQMDNEAIAGTIVGAVLGVALLICCIYPFVIARYKRRKRNRLAYDCEFRGQDECYERARRLSSSDSYHKRNENDCADYQTDRQPTTPGYVNATLDPSIAIEQTVDELSYWSNPFPGTHHGQVLPEGTLPHQIVLKGTSEDYYSPYIPSEAFGMYPTPEPDPNIPRPDRIAPRGTSLSYNVKQLFRRKGTRELATHDPNARGYGETNAEAADLPESAPMQQYYDHHNTIGSPMGMMTGFADLPYSDQPAPQLNRGSVCIEQEPGYTEVLFSNAQGTVNPMDIMPACTESEVWHRTDYELHTTSPYGSPPSFVPSSEHTPIHTHAPEAYPIPSQLHVPQMPLSAPPPPPEFTQPSQPQQILSPSQFIHPGIMLESQTKISPQRTSQDAGSRRPSNAVHSDMSTSIQGAASATTQSTPSTHVDTPSPESLNSSDCGHQSASPHATGAPSPKSGVYACDEPGCNQVFDQPHKLKHHQRYHSKDHKCPYPSCGKGFGTKTHLQRHINDRHEKKKKFHCSIQGCDYSRAGGKAFPRKDNWKRHMTKIHGMDHRRLPEPVEVDHEMTGV